MIRAIAILSRVEWGHPDSAFMQKHRPGYWRECPCCRAEVTEEVARTPTLKHAGTHRPGCELAAELDAAPAAEAKKAAVATAIDSLLEAAHEASSVDCHVTDKARLYAAIIAYARAAGIPCRACGKADCERKVNEEGELLCDPNTAPEDE